MAKRKTITSSRFLTQTEGEAILAQKAYEETKGKKGKALAKKIANVGKPKGKKPKGSKLVGPSGRATWQTTYEPAYTPKQRKAIKKAKVTVSQMRTERGRTATRATAVAKRTTKKK